MNLYIIESGDGYFVEFVNDTPLMITDPVSARRMDIADAHTVNDCLERLGFESNIVPVTLAKIDAFDNDKRKDE